MKNTLRFFVEPELLAHDEVRISDANLVHQLSRVLRLAPGDQILLLDGAGQACEVALTALERHTVQGSVVQRGPASGEPPVFIQVYVAVIRPERFEWAIQKCVEVGASQIVPVQFARSQGADRADARRLERWQRIGREAAEQACRGILPMISGPVSFAEACEQASNTALPLILWEGSAPTLRSRLATLSVAPARCAIMAGPEGGITPDELTAASERGIMPASLGPRILRAETAPVIAAGAICYHFE